MRKKVDQRIRTLVENGVKLRQRSLFVIVGDRGREQARRSRCTAVACITECVSRQAAASLLASFVTGCQSALYAVESERQSAPERVVVLQERPLPQQPSEEAHEAGDLRPCSLAPQDHPWLRRSRLYF